MDVWSVLGSVLDVSDCALGLEDLLRIRALLRPSRGTWSCAKISLFCAWRKRTSEARKASEAAIAARPRGNRAAGVARAPTP